MISKHPPGLPYIVGNEAAERFSYYGMKAILVVFMTTHLLDASGSRRVMSSEDATFWYHIFGMANYIVPVIGAVLADALWGKYRTIIVLSLVYCLGHAALALDETRQGLLVGLSLIAIGAGGIKPCVSAHLGDQYRNYPASLRSDGYSLFYIAINIGAFISSMATPLLLEWYGPRVAFGVPGILMATATLTFWLGRRVYVVEPPTPFKEYVRGIVLPEQRRHIALILWLFVCLSVFWALFDQTGSSWVLQAEGMDRRLVLPLFGKIEMLPSQIQSINPILILLFAPLCTWGLYPLLERRGWLSPRGKVATGMVLSAVAFVLVGYAQTFVASGAQPSVMWQVAAFIVLTAAEVVVSITTLELAYTSAPMARRSLVTSFYLLSVSLGNGLTALLVGPLAHYLGGPSTSTYFYAFAGLSLVAVVPVWLLLTTIQKTVRN